MQSQMACMLVVMRAIVVTGFEEVEYVRECSWGFLRFASSNRVNESGQGGMRGRRLGQCSCVVPLSVLITIELCLNPKWSTTAEKRVEKWMSDPFYLVGAKRSGGDRILDAQVSKPTGSMSTGQAGMEGWLCLRMMEFVCGCREATEKQRRRKKGESGDSDKWPNLPGDLMMVKVKTDNEGLVPVTEDEAEV